MVFLSQNHKEINNEVSALLRVVRSHYRNEIKIQVMNDLSIREFKLNVMRKTQGFYKFLFLVKIPKEYPLEPMWAEPVIVGRTMRSHLAMKNFKSHRLRPLIDDVLNFCQKYEYVNSKSLVITFPSTCLYGEESVASKVFVLVNRALAKLKYALPNHITKQTKRFPPTLPRFNDNLGFYNDMGISMVGYASIFDKLRGKTRKFSNVRDRGNDLFYGKNIVRRSRYLRGISAVNEKGTRRTNVHDLKDIKYCKLNFSEDRGLLYSFLEIPDGISRINFLDDFTVELGENLRIRLMKIHDVLIVREMSLGDGAGPATTSLTRYEARPNNLRNRSSLSLLLSHSRELLSMDTYERCLQSLMRSFNLPPRRIFVRINMEEEEIAIMVQRDLKAGMHEPVFVMVGEENEGLFMEELEDAGLDYVNIVPDEFKRREHGRLSLPAEINFSDTVKMQPLSIKSALQSVLFLKGDLPTEDTDKSESFDRPQTRRTAVSSRLISEVIHYPKSSTDAFEYALDLDPRNDRHRALLGRMDILRHDEHALIEILASTDYELDCFFIKEIVNPGSKKFIVRLHKLSSQNLVSNLVKEENLDCKSLSDANRTQWCLRSTWDFSFTSFSSLYSILSAYIRKLQRDRLVVEMASKFKCQDLKIRRCNFDKDFIDSLSLFDKSH